MSISDQSLRDFHTTRGQPGGDKIIDLEAAGQAKLKEGGREDDGSPLKTPQLELIQDGKVWMSFTPKLFVHIVHACIFKAHHLWASYGTPY